MEQEHLVEILTAILFTSGRPLKAKELAKILELEEGQVAQCLDGILEKQSGEGVILIKGGSEYQLATNSKYSTQVKNFLNAELREKLTDATVEVLAIIAYREPISKAEIEAIRGVNSQYSLRNLLMRGLIEKVSNPGDARSFLYKTTTELMMHLGLSSAKALPEFEKLAGQIRLPETPALDRPENKTDENLVSVGTKSTENLIIKPAESNEPSENIDQANPLIEAVGTSIDQKKNTSAEPVQETDVEDEGDSDDEDDDEQDNT